MSKYFTVTVKPTMPVATQIQSDKTDLPFAQNDLFWDWHAFDIPKGAAKLIHATLLVRGENASPQTARHFQVYFAKSHSGGTAPSSMGTGNASVDGTGYYNELLGGIHFQSDSFLTNLDYMSMCVTGFGGNTDQIPNMVLEGEPESGTNVGYDKLYIAGVGGASNTWDFATGVLANGAVTSGASTDITVDGVDARKVFAKGDVIHVHDSDTAIGTVSSIPDATSILIESANGVAIADDDEIVNASPITVILSFEQ